MDIGKYRDNFDKDRKPRCFNCNIYKYMTKNCQKLKKEKEIRKCYKYNRVGHLVKNCRSEQKIKNKSIHKELGKKDDNRPRRKKQFSF